MNRLTAIKRRIPAMILIALFGWAGHDTLTEKALGQPAPDSLNGAVVLDRIVAIVNGEVITFSELKEAMTRMQLGLPDLGTAVNTKAESLRSPVPHPPEREALNRLIERKLQLQLAQRRGITVESEEVEEALEEIKKRNGISTDEALEKALLADRSNLDQYKSDLREQLLILKLANREVKSGILLNEEELREYYQNYLDRYSLPDEIHLRQILLRIPQPELKEVVWQKAQEMVAQLRAGTDFKSLARQESSGPEAKEEGDLGFVKKGQVLPLVEQAISGLAPSEVSDPVITSAGVHIFYVEEVKTGQIRPFEEVKQQIRESLFQERSAKSYSEWLQNLRDAAQVEIRF